MADIGVLYYCYYYEGECVFDNIALVFRRLTCVNVLLRESENENESDINN